MRDFAARLELEPEPRSAAAARAWTREVLREIRREDLAESATAGVSELVTNGILHAQTPIMLVLQTFGERVVLTVTDRSPVHAAVRLSPTVPRDEDSTVGRGLRIVRAYARDWGVTSSPHGKSIWFVPAETPHSVSPSVLPELDLLGDEEPAETVIEGPRARVYLIGTPVAVLRYFQDRWNEIVREMQLIALAEPSDLQALADELCELVPATRAARWMSADSSAAITEAVLAGEDDLDLELEIPLRARDAFARTLEITRDLENREHRESLLSVSGSTQSMQWREWWFGEIVRQLDGSPPTAWRGALTVQDELN
jgi:anti-sigma regulatory factor (Ser/Thr protein kinase)